jgi:hypothetical protein
VRLRLIAAAAAVLVTSFMASSSVVAAPSSNQQSSPRGIVLSPAVIQANVASTEAEHPIEFQVTNNTPKAQTLNISTTDFNTLNETGGLVFVGSNPSKLQKKYGLATWIVLPQTSIFLQPNQTTTISAVISNQGSLAPGGHYGALMLALESSGQSSSSNKIAVHPIASSLLFINKAGGDTHRLKLTNIYANHSIFKVPDSLTLRFYNDGNTHLIPRGTVEITDPKGKLVSKGIINENSNLILPETYRRYSVPVNKISNGFLPGKYKLTTNFRFDGYDQFRTYQESILIIPPAFLLLILVVVLATTSFVAFIFRKKLGLKVYVSRLKRILFKHK